VNLPAFTPLVGDSFELRLPEGVGLRLLLLLEARDLGPRPLGPPGDHSFSLIFRSNSRSHLPQAIYAVGHPKLGDLELFLVPIGPDAEGRMRYQAVFN